MSQSRMSRSLSYQLPGNGDGVLDVNEFERCLEGIGLQLGNFNLMNPHEFHMNFSN